MHIVIALIGAVAGLLFALNRLQDSGFNLNALNPFLWARRRKWQQQYTGNPLYGLDRPIDAAALLMVATAKSNGDISLEEKTLILRTFETEFELSAREAADMLGSMAHLLGADTDIVEQLPNILERSKEQFTPEQAASTKRIMGEIAALDGHTDAKTALIEETGRLLDVAVQPAGKWE